MYSFEIPFLKFFIFIFKSSLHPIWGLNSQCRDQEAHTLPTEPARCPSFEISDVGPAYGVLELDTVDTLALMGSMFRI